MVTTLCAHAPLLELRDIGLVPGALAVRRLARNPLG
jgi:hypothetical protein